MPEDTAPVEGQEPVAEQGQESAPEAAPQDDAAGTPEKFDRAYVEKLRQENASRRQAEKEARDELQRIQQERKEAEEQAAQANMSELQKLQKQAEKTTNERNTFEAQLSEAYATIAHMTMQQEVRDALAAASVRPERLAQAMRHVDFDTLEVDDDGSIKGVEDAIATVQTEVPEWFKTAPANVGAGGTAPGNEPQQKKSVADMTDEEIQALSQQAAWGARITL